MVSAIAISLYTFNFFIGSPFLLKKKKISEGLPQILCWLVYRSIHPLKGVFSTVFNEAILRKTSGGAMNPYLLSAVHNSLYIR